MNKRFVSLGVVLAVLLVSLALGGAYGAYKYKQVIIERDQVKRELESQKDLEIEKLKAELEARDINMSPTSTNEVSVAVDTEIQPEKNNDTSDDLKVETLTQKTEANVAFFISQYYQSNALDIIDGYIDLLDVTVIEINRYINGIPTVVNNFRSMMYLSLTAEEASGAEPYLEEWEDGYIKDFTDLKNRVNQIQAEMKKQRDLLIIVSNDLRTQYVPASQSKLYSDEIDSYNSKIDAWINEVNVSMSGLTGRFIADKDYTNELIYSLANQNSKLVQPTLPTYSPPKVNTSAYKPPIRTYCQNFGTSMSCTSYSN